MFKSVFTKYITAFMLIIVISFTLLAAIISSMMVNYANENKRDVVYSAAISIKKYHEGQYSRSNYTSFEDFVNGNITSIQLYLSTFVNYTGNLMLFVTDTDGNILVTDGTYADVYNSTTIPKGILQSFSNGNYQAVTDLDGVFSSDYLVQANTISIKGGAVGYVFACSPSGGMNKLVQTMIKTIVMVSLWVLLAALIAVYFISEKIIGPLKEMSHTAKSFAAGKFDVRVPVTGRDEVSELAIAFNNMAGSLANLENMRYTFLANISHDLRTPMTTISGFIDGILDGAIPPDKHEYYLKVIEGEVKRLSRLVSTLLDLSRIQAGDRKFVMTVFDISEMARLILISFEKKIEDKKLDVIFEADEEKLYVSADRDAIYQILYNICDNAVKFSCEGGKYRIRLISRDKKVYVSVYNEGQGIKAEELPYVFDRFYKSDKSRGLDKSGVGLGLYIAKTIIDAHNEEIWVKSVYGEYCEFVFTLQLATESQIKKFLEKNEK